MKTKIGILYSLENVNAWKKYKKCGRTTQKINKRLSNLQTSLLDNCEIIYMTDTLLDCYFYEYLLKQILKKYRPRHDREFYDVEFDEIKEIFQGFNFINQILNTPEKLNSYIEKNYPEYLNKKRKYVKSESSSDNSNNINKIKPLNNKPKRKKKRGLFIDTSY